MGVNEITPGPWQARFIYRMVKAARETPGLLITADPANDWADSCLMAASPDLLAACKALLDASGPSLYAAMKQARDAIAKAEGKE